MEIWPCGYVAARWAQGGRGRAITTLRYLDPGATDHEIDACDTHASELCDALRVIDRKR